MMSPSFYFVNISIQNQAAENEVTLVEGNVYAVLYDEDDWWYRGLVESVMNGEKVTVIFTRYRSAFENMSLKPYETRLRIEKREFA